MLLLRNKDNSRTIRSRLSQPASAGEGGYMSELQARGDWGHNSPGDHHGGAESLLETPNVCWSRRKFLTISQLLPLIQ